MLLLDTNIVSYWMRGNLSIINRLKHYRPKELAISTITLAEILYGIEKSPVKKRERYRKIDSICTELELYPFDEAAAREYAAIRSYLEKKGIPISERDLQIASIAMAINFHVVTHNTREFNRIPKLVVEDWFDS